MLPIKFPMIWFQMLCEMGHKTNMKKRRKEGKIKEGEKNRSNDVPWGYNWKMQEVLCVCYPKPLPSSVLASLWFRSVKAKTSFTHAFSKLLLQKSLNHKLESARIFWKDFTLWMKGMDKTVVLFLLSSFFML